MKQFILCAAGCRPLTTALSVWSKLVAAEVYAVTLWRPCCRSITHRFDGVPLPVIRLSLADKSINNSCRGSVAWSCHLELSCYCTVSGGREKDETLRPYAEWIVWQEEPELTFYSHVIIQIKWRRNIHGYIHSAAKVWYPHLDMDISMDIHIHGNPGNWSFFVFCNFPR